MGRGRSAWRCPLVAVLLLAAYGDAARSADFREGNGVLIEREGNGALVEEVPPLPRFFPREDGDQNGPVIYHPRRQRIVGCVPRRVPIPTNEPGDPSYVGSTYGLSKPSIYGFTPPLGVDDPYGRPLLRYCP